MLSLELKVRNGECPNLLSRIVCKQSFNYTLKTANQVLTLQTGL